MVSRQQHRIMYVCSFKWHSTVLKCYAELSCNRATMHLKAMAEHIAGNEGTFVHMMNEEAKRIWHEQYPVL